MDIFCKVVPKLKLILSIAEIIWGRISMNPYPETGITMLQCAKKEQEPGDPECQIDDICGAAGFHYLRMTVLTNWPVQYSTFLVRKVLTENRASICSDFNISKFIHENSDGKVGGNSCPPAYPLSVQTVRVMCW